MGKASTSGTSANGAAARTGSVRATRSTVPSKASKPATKQETKATTPRPKPGTTKAKAEKGRTRANGKSGSIRPVVIDLAARENALREFVKGHLDMGRGHVLFAIWFHANDPENLHVLEVAEKVSYAGEADWVTLSFIPPEGLDLPGVRALKFTYMGPEEFQQGVQDVHPLYSEILESGSIPIYVRRRNRLAERLLKAFDHARPRRP